MRTLLFTVALVAIAVGPLQAQDLPVLAEGLEVEVYAGLDFTPGTIDFDDEQHLYIANRDPGTVPIYRATATSSLVTFGAGIPDPDALMVDRAGVLGQPGSALVGGAVGGCPDACRGRITEVRPDGTTRTLLEGGCLGNIDRFALDSQGRIFVSNTTNQHTICVIQNGASSLFLGPFSATPSGLAIDDQDRIYVTLDSVTRQYSSTGQLLDASFAAGNVKAYISHGPFRGLALWRDGNLVLVDVDTRAEWTVAYGLIALDVVEDEAGDLYVSEYTKKRILHIAPIPAPAPLPIADAGILVEEYVRVFLPMGELAIDADDNLYVGNFNVGRQCVFTIPRDDPRPVALGVPIMDPDAVTVDVAGILATPGYILSGGALSGCPDACYGRIAAISPDGLETTSVAQGGCLGNIQGFASFDPSVIYANNNEGTVCRITAGSISSFVGPGPGTSTSISENSAVDADGNFFLSWDNWTRKFDSGGNLLDDTFTQGAVKAYANQGPLAGLAIVRGRQLLLMDEASGTERMLLDDVEAKSLVYDSAGDLYVVDRENRRILRVWAAFGSIDGYVRANCADPDTGLVGVTVDVFATGTGDLVDSITTGEDGSYAFADLPAGDYSLSLVTPLGYVPAQEQAVTVGGGQTLRADFDLVCTTTTGDPRGIGFWKHQVGVATGGRGHAHIDTPTLCGHLDTIAAHFHSNEINPVEIYLPPVSGLCEDKLLTAKDLLNLKGKQEMIARARQHLMAVLMNVADGRLHLMDSASEDQATISQAITWCDQLIDDPAGDHERAKDIAESVNKSNLVPAGWIPLDTDNISYKQPPTSQRHEFALGPNHPNPFNPRTTIRFSLPQSEHVELVIYDLSGRHVRTLLSQPMVAGPHEVSWAGQDDADQAVASGVYLYQLRAGIRSEARRMALLR